MGANWGMGRSRGREIAELKSRDTGESDAEDEIRNTNGIRKKTETR